MKTIKNKIILLSSNQLGKGSEELGTTILETFFNILKNNETLPYAVFCMNEGVLTLTDQSFVSVQLKELEDKGVKVLACKTCVEYYKLNNAIKVGQLDSMKTFVDLASKYEVVTLS